MAETESRLEQFRKMAEADPNNELGHFSLGKAYLDAGRDAQAIAALQRALGLNPNLSKVYHLIASAQVRLGEKDTALQTLQKGVAIAQERGDLMPRNEMAKMIRDLGGTPPEFASSTTQAVGEGQVLCNRCGRIGPKLPKPPFRNAIGQEIFTKTCADCWREWIGMGTKVINELRLPLNDPQAQRIYDQHMREFLNLG